MQKNKISWLLRVIGLTAMVVVLVATSGCGGGLQTLITNHVKYGDISTTTKLAHPIFLGDIPPEKRVACVITNANDQDIDLSRTILLLERKGVRYSKNCGPGVYIIQVMVTHAGKQEENSVDQWLHSPYGNPWAMTGTATMVGAGAMVGAYATQGLGGAIGGGLIGFGAQLLDTVAGAMSEKGICVIATQIEVTEPSFAQVAQTKTSNLRQGTSTLVTQQVNASVDHVKYQTNAVTTAVKVNLKFDEAKPELEKSLSEAIAGIFPTPLIPLDPIRKAQM